MIASVIFIVVTLLIGIIFYRQCDMDANPGYDFLCILFGAIFIAVALFLVVNVCVKYSPTHVIKDYQNGEYKEYVIAHTSDGKTETKRTYYRKVPVDYN